MGRPTLFTPARIGIILESVRAGQSIARAAFRARVDDSTVCKWAERGEREADGPYFQFFNDLKAAEADCELALILTVKSAAKTQWQAGAWLLERKWPTEWGRLGRLDLAAPGATPEAGSAVLEIHIPAKRELPDVQKQGAGGEAEADPAGVVQPVDGAVPGLRQPARSRGKGAAGRKGPAGAKGRKAPPKRSKS